MAESQKTVVIAEVAQAHDGSLGTAHAYIDAVASTGADGIKFQTHIASAESTRLEPWRIPFSYQDASRFDYWRRMEFSADQWQALKNHAVERGLAFYSSPFSEEAVDLLASVGVAGWKIASGEVANPFLLNAVLKYPRPYILSTGLCSLEELDSAVARLRTSRQPVTILQCTTEYPTPPERVGLNMIQEFRRRYDCDSGLSDHSGTIFPAIAAAALGATMVEVHIAFSRDVFGPDTVASVTVPELAQIVQGVRFVARCSDRPTDMNTQDGGKRSLRQGFGRSLVAARDLKAGEVIEAGMISFKKPGGGFGADRFDGILGRTLRLPVSRDQQFADDDFD